MEKQFIYVGSVGSIGKQSKGSITGHGEGITTLSFCENQLERIDCVAANDAGILCMSPNGKTLYAANESKDFTGLNGSGGGVTAYHIENGHLTKLNDSISYGSRPSNLTVSKDGKYLLVSNHGSHSTVTCSYEKNDQGQWVLKRGFDDASVAMFLLEEDGSLGPLCDLKVFQGSGYWNHGGGQSTSHLHTVRERDDYVFACNRGADRIEVMKINRKNHTLDVLKENETKPGYAPRHLCFHPTKKMFYVCNENYPSVSTYTYKEDGTIQELQCEETMPSQYYQVHPLPHFTKRHAEETEKNTCGFADRTCALPADIHVSMNGKFVYVSNRLFSGNGVITCFAMDEQGYLHKNGTYELEGHDPRGIKPLPGNLLLVGLMDQDQAILYQTNEDTGMIETVVSKIPVKSCASFVL